MAHTASLTLFEAPGVVVGVAMVGLAALSILGLLAHERKRAKVGRRSRNVLARAEQEFLAGATVRELHLDERDKREVHPPIRVDRLLRDHHEAELRTALHEEADRLDDMAAKWHRMNDRRDS